MSHIAYFEYLDALFVDIRAYFCDASSETQRVIFELSASPYHYWLQNQAVLAPKPSVDDVKIGQAVRRALTPPQESSAGKHPPAVTKPDLGSGHSTTGIALKPEDSSNLANITAVADVLDASNIANKAQEIREKARTSIRVYMKTCESQWPADATSALMALAADWGPGKTVYRALDLIPDKELCLWNDKHEVF